MEEWAEVEAPILWPCDTNSLLTGKDPDAGKDGRQEKRVTEDEMVGWHHRLNGHEFEQILGDSVGQGSLACCSPWNRKESNMTWGQNNSNQLGRHLSVTSQTLLPATREAEISLMTKGLKTKGV